MLPKHSSPGQRLLTVFVLTILVPGFLLAILGVRALFQERRLAEQQLHNRLEHSAELTIRALADQFSKLQSLVDDGLKSERVLEAPVGSWAYAESDGSNSRVLPENVLPYELSATAPLGKAQPPSTAETKHQLARALQKSGNTSEALKLWHEIQNGGGKIGNLPAPLVAEFEIAAIDDTTTAEFYQHLTEGRWRLEKPRYLYYLSVICRRLGKTMEGIRHLRLAEAVEGALSSSTRVAQQGDTIYAVFRRETPPAVLVVGPEFLSAKVWPRLMASTDADVSLLRVSANGQILYKAPLGAESKMVAVRTIDVSGMSLQVEVEPKDAAGMQASVNRTTSLYLAMLALIVVLLAFGGYFIARTVRRELEVARMKAEFVSTVSHEFRSPLTGIRQLGEMLARDRVSEESKRHQYYELIVHESERLARLVENVLDFSRMEEGRKQYRFEPLDTAAWLNTVVEDFQLEARRTGYQLDVRIPAQLPMVSGDREALSTAVRNLLDNACKYSPQSKTVWLEAEAVSGGVRVHVRDRGVGIPAREQRHIFEKFYRGDGELGKQVKGVGLGLSLVQHIVTAHRGDVRVSSREGEGSTFSIYLVCTS
jgi:signal transduction histidine kinase